MLAILSFGIYQVAIWTGNEVIVPLFKRQMDFIDSLEGTVDEINTSLKDARELNSKNNALLLDSKKSGDRVVELLGSINEKLHKQK